MANYWHEIAKKTGFEVVATLKACISKEGWERLKKAGYRENQRKLSPKQVSIVYDEVGQPV
ncbi:hypothetical protein QQ054_01000 [Oscillatoria amoena NRMC-F 0135]|nr:hypothetical protein [Oscillatoria amoena NRMC-F 0135]